MLHRPGGIPRARNSSASHAGAPGARGSNGWTRLGALATRQRIRAPLKLAWPPSRIKKAATPDRSAATASRRVAVKSRALGSPHNSPITAPRPGHLRPSSIAHKAARESCASTWMSWGQSSPGGCTRPVSRIAIRSCTHSNGLPRSTCASRNPAQPGSRGCAAKISLSVGRAEPGMTQRSPAPLGTTCSTAGDMRASAPSPTIRNMPLATRLTTFLFFFCS